MDVNTLIDKLKLIPHPEGGYYKETHRSEEMMVTPEGNSRQVSTAIYYMLEGEQKSLFHRIKSDELWFFHQGTAVEITCIQDDKLHTILLGNNLEQGEQPQATVPANT